MNIIGVILLVLGCVGLWFGTFMFGDIGVVATFSAIIALITGVGFIKIDHDNNKE